METKFAIDQKDGDYSDEKYFRRLIRSIEVSQKYFLFFVACNQIPRQNELIADIKAELPTKNIEVVNFKEPITDLLFELETILADKKPDAIFVQGLGNSISSDGTGDANNVIYALNISRDSFNDAFQCPIYLWLPEYAVIKITRNAPDFFSVRSGVFYFSSTAEQVISDIFQSTSSEWLETSSLPLAEKQKRIANLENLLAEYQGLDEEKRDKQAEMRLYSQLASLFNSISDYRKMIEYYERALECSKEIGHKQGEGSILGYLGNAYLSLGNSEKAEKYYKKALKILETAKDIQGIKTTLGNIGNIHLSLGENKKAVRYYKKALIMPLENNKSINNTFILTNLGIALNNLGEYSNSIKYQKDALKIATDIGDLQGKSNILNNLGLVYLKTGEYKKVIECCQQSLEIARKIGNQELEGSSLCNLGVANYNLVKLEKAKEYYIQAITIFEKLESSGADFVRQKLENLNNILLINN
jgi:tetratricopeptide (TPR) repeat protein